MGGDLTEDPHSAVAARADPAPPRIAPNAPTDADGTARQVCEADAAVDALNEQIFRELLTFMMEDPRTIPRAIRLLLVSRFLERVADHATNIAEMVIYMVESKLVQHTLG